MDCVELFNDSYERIVARNRDVFFVKFYENFLEKSPEIASAFKNTDMQRQINMLEHSLMMMIDFASVHTSSEYLERLAVFHSEKNISGDFFNYWLDALVETLQQLDNQFDSDEALSWRIMMSPGIEFMRGFPR